MGVLFLGTGQIVPPIIAAPVVGMLFLAADGGFGTAAAVGGPEVNCVHIALVVHIDNGATVTGDGLSFVVFFKGETIAIFSIDIPNAVTIVVVGQDDLRAGGAGAGALALIAEASVIRVLNPVDDGIGRIGVGSPDRIQSNALRQLVVKGIRLTIQRPAAKLIARLLRSNRLNRDIALIEEVRLHDGAAVGIIGDPETLDNNGVERDVLFGDGQSFIANILTALGQAPSGNAQIGTDGEAHIGGNNGLVLGILLGDLDTVLIIQEVHIVDFLKLSRIGIGDAADAGLCAGDELGTVAEPAGELVARLLGGGRSVDSLARLDLLGAHRLVAHHKLVGVDLGRGVHDIHFVDIRPRFRLHIVDAEGPVLGGLRREGQGSGAVLIGEDVIRVGVHGNGAVHSGQGHIRAGLAGDGDGVDQGVGERHLRTLRGFLLQVTADGVGHIGRLLLGGSLLGGCGGHGDLPDLFLVAHGIGNGGIALGYAVDIGNSPASIIDPAQSGSSRVIGIGPCAAGLRGRGQGDGLANRYASVIGLLFLRLRFRRIGSLSFLFRRIGSLSFLFRRIGSLGFLFRRIGSLRGLGLHDGRLRLGDYRGGGAEREGVGGA